MAGLVKDWNAALKFGQDAVEEQNKKLLELVKNGEMTMEAALAGWSQLPHPVKPPSASWARSFQQKWGWSLLSKGSQGGGWLPYNHPDMVHARQATQALFESRGVHEALLLNFDQMWRTCFSFDGKLRFKPRAFAGQKVPKQKTGQHESKKLHHVSGCRKSLTAPCLL